jgi:hypothetical protein
VRILLRTLLLVTLSATASARALVSDRPDVWVELRSPHFVVVSNAGEKTARGVAREFEEIRGVFHQAFPSLHVDPGKPMLVLAVKGEDLMKALLPDYWKTDGGMRPAGMYVTSFDENFAVLRVDTGEPPENAHRPLYHEYAHAIQKLNFRELPLWLSEGLADFFGNTLIVANDVEFGHINAAELNLLRRGSLLPLEALMKVDAESPLYDEKNRASIFYAESWALVHYLLLNLDASKNQPLLRYVAAYAETRDAVTAAKSAFGDLNQLQGKLESYVKQGTFQAERMKSTSSLPEKDFRQ